MENMYKLHWKVPTDWLDLCYYCCRWNPDCVNVNFWAVILILWWQQRTKGFTSLSSILFLTSQFILLFFHSLAFYICWCLTRCEITFLSTENTSILPLLSNTIKKNKEKKMFFSRWMHIYLHRKRTEKWLAALNAPSIFLPLLFS